MSMCAGVLPLAPSSELVAFNLLRMEDLSLNLAVREPGKLLVCKLGLWDICIGHL